MDEKEIIRKIMKKKEYSQLPFVDVKRVLEKFQTKELSDSERVKLVRRFLMENYSSFGSRKILVKQNPKKEWVLKKHLSTRERFSSYKEIYERVLEGLPKDKKLSVVDLGCGVNGFSYEFFKEAGFRVGYVGVEAIGQFVKKTNAFFERKNIQGRVFHESLMNLEKVLHIVKKTKKPRVVFLLKVIDSLESLERNYSKKLILSLREDVERFVVSFPLKSMVKRDKIWAKRTWFLRFLKHNFKLLRDFEIAEERFLIFENK